MNNTKILSWLKMIEQKVVSIFQTPTGFFLIPMLMPRVFLLFIGLLKVLQKIVKQEKE